MREFFDSTDRRLSKLLSDNAQDSVNQLADKMQLSAPTVRARLRSLIDRNVLKIVGLLNLSERPELIGAVVGINANAQGNLDDLIKKIGDLPFVSSVSIVTRTVRPDRRGADSGRCSRSLPLYQRTSSQGCGSWSDQPQRNIRGDEVA
ncbi:AsnC family transcriptional regulator [Polaromonas sp. P1(28)-8]|nr:AsnC family transcriptional regulator [Polaromonas sp. P1(28)-8]